MPQVRSGVRRWGDVLGCLAMTAFVVGPALAHFRIVPAMTGFLLFDVGGFLGAIAAIVGVVAALRGAPWNLGLAFGLPVTATFLAVALPARRFPPINDITTDTANPPRFEKAASLPANLRRNLDYPGASFAEQQRGGYPELRPWQTKLPPDQVFGRVQSAAKQMPDWEITAVEPASRTLEGVATSRLFRFQDDFIIEVRPQGEGSVVQMRSKSRDGKGDIGANAARIKAFFARLGAS